MPYEGGECHSPRPVSSDDEMNEVKSHPGPECEPSFRTGKRYTGQDTVTLNGHSKAKMWDAIERNSGVGIGYLPTYICVDARADVREEGTGRGAKLGVSLFKAVALERKRERPRYYVLCSGVI